MATKLIVAFFALLAASGANAATRYWTYEVTGAPRTSSCDDDAARFGERFTVAAGVAVYRAECVLDTGLTYNLSLTYISEDRLVPVSAVHGLFWEPDDGGSLPPSSIDKPLWGIYSSLEDCLSDIPRQNAQYETHTGLAVVASACDHGSVGGYVLRIDGFGAPAERFLPLKVEFHGSSDQAYADALGALSQTAGADVVSATPWGSYVIVLYWAVEPVVIVSRTIHPNGQLDDAAQCETELAIALKAIRDTTGVSPHLGRCLPDSYDQSAYMNFAFTSADPIAYPLRQTTGATYATYQGCVSDRAHAIAIATADGLDVRGGVCTRTSIVAPSRFQMNLLGR